jgi:omega-6 fatty acid desaturase (delta-12 desaturase)
LGPEAGHISPGNRSGTIFSLYPAAKNMVKENRESLASKNQPDVSDWKNIIAEYQNASTGRAVWQIVNTLVPYVLLWCIMYFTVSVSWWLTLPLALLSGGFLIRLFIIFHDCGHGSFFKSKRANNIWGFVSGLLTFTPFHHWRWEHAIHHATSGDLDRRGTGDIPTMTVQEYLQSSRGKRLAYRMTRNPFVLFVLAPLYMFLVRNRWAKADANRRERLSVYWMNFAILVMAAGMTAIFGLKAYVLIQFTALLVAGGTGFWLFYVQHQFEGVYWERRENWDHTAAALEGSSFYKLPRVLQWFSGNIGFHHIHHLSSRIPNYNLEKCHRANPCFQTVKTVSLFASFKSLTFRLWDEQRRMLVGFRGLNPG